MKNIAVAFLLLCTFKLFAANPTLAGTNVFTGSNNFVGPATLHDVTIAGATPAQFAVLDSDGKIVSTLDGSSLNSLNATHITSGTVPLARLPAASVFPQTNGGVIYSFNSLGQFTMTNPASLPNPSGWTMGTNGHYRGVDQYGNIREWTTNRFMVQTSVGGASKTLIFSNDTLTVDGALVITNGIGIVLPSILAAGALPASVTVPAGSMPALTGAVTTSAGSAVTALGSFSSASLSTAVSDETGSGALVFANNPIITGGIFNGTNNGSFAGSMQGVGNTIAYGLNLQAVPKTLFIIGHSRSVKLAGLTDPGFSSWISYGGYTNAVASGSFTNDAWGRKTLMYRPVGTAYAAGNNSFWDIMLRKTYGTNGNNIGLDTACAVPGNTIWNTWMGRPAFISYFESQGWHGNLYYGSNNQLNSGGLTQPGGRWNRFWVQSTNELGLSCNGFVFTNLVVGNSYLFWGGGAIGSGQPITVWGYTNSVFGSYIYNQNFVGNQYAPNYLPPYISQNNIGSNSISPVVAWIDSNAPAITGIPAAIAIGPFGGNDFLGVPIVDTNLCAYNVYVISNLCAHAIALGYPPPFVLTEDLAFGSTNTTLATNILIFNTLEKQLPPSICKMVDIGTTNILSGFDSTSGNFISDNAHYSTNGANLMGFTVLSIAGFVGMNPPPVFTGNFPPYLPGIWDSNLTGNTYYVVPGTSTNASPVNGTITALTTFATNFTTSTIGINNWNRPIELFPNVNYGEAGVVGVSSLQLEVVGFSTNYAVPMVTIIGGVAQTLKGSVMPIIVPAGSTWYFRDTSSGAGNSCSPTNGTIQIQ